MPGGILFSGSREVKENNGLHEKERGGVVQRFFGRWIQRPIASPHASIKASEKLGCAWIISAVSSTVISAHISAVGSAIISAAMLP